MLLWAMFGQPTDGFLRKEMFLRYMERTSGGITPGTVHYPPVLYCVVIAFVLIRFATVD
jgi:hypothetical protein